jgi:hypothetical protein
VLLSCAERFSLWLVLVPDPEDNPDASCVRTGTLPDETVAWLVVNDPKLEADTTAEVVSVAIEGTCEPVDDAP